MVLKSVLQEHCTKQGGRIYTHYLVQYSYLSRWQHALRNRVVVVACDRHDRIRVHFITPHFGRCTAVHSKQKARARTSAHNCSSATPSSIFSQSTERANTFANQQRDRVTNQHAVSIFMDVCEIWAFLAILNLQCALKSTTQTSKLAVYW